MRWFFLRRRFFFNDLNFWAISSDNVGRTEWNTNEEEPIEKKKKSRQPGGHYQMARTTKVTHTRRKFVFSFFPMILLRWLSPSCGHSCMGERERGHHDLTHTQIRATARHGQSDKKRRKRFRWIRADYKKRTKNRMDRGDCSAGDDVEIWCLRRLLLHRSVTIILAVFNLIVLDWWLATHWLSPIFQVQFCDFSP